MHIDIDTKFIMLIGTPLRQSFAARMQNAAYKASGMNMRYFYNEADSSHLREILDGLRYTKAFAGAAVTRPNKVAVLKYLDELDPLCEKMGSCNTIVKEADGSLVGYNTDGPGFYESLSKGDGIVAPGRRFFCIGAGGAGRAMCSALAYYGAEKIYVTDVVMDCADDLVKSINANFSPVAEQVPYGQFDLAEECDCILNASGIGMGSSIGKTPLPKENIKPGQIFFDACYNPDKTQFLLNAEAAGCKTLNGLGMSLYQGARQIKLWTGQDAPLEVMRSELLQIVDERTRSNQMAEEPEGTKIALDMIELLEDKKDKE